MNLEGQFVAIKIHFGELGNVSYLRPNYARAVVDVVKELGGKPFLTDCNTLYPGSRKNALEHLDCAWENGFTPLTVGCPILIGDGLKGTDDIEVPVRGGEYVKNAKIGRAVMDADVFISLTHFKGHETTGFGGALKNHRHGLRLPGGQEGAAQQRQALCTSRSSAGAAAAAMRECANDGLVFDAETRKMHRGPGHTAWAAAAAWARATSTPSTSTDDNSNADAELPHRRVRQGGGGRAAPASTFRW